MHMKLVFAFEEKAGKAVAQGADIEEVSAIPVREAIGRFKAVPYSEYKTEYDRILQQMNLELSQVLGK